MKDQHEYTIRIGGELLEKLAYVAKSEGRTLNNQCLLMARNSVAYFERTKGKITPDKLKELETQIEE